VNKNITHEPKNKNRQETTASRKPLFYGQKTSNFSAHDSTINHTPTKKPGLTSPAFLIHKIKFDLAI
jgi:hypothetical protein